MTDAWDGRPENPERDGWHWVKALSSKETIALFWTHVVAEWEYGDDWLSSQQASRRYRYLGPCLTPAELAAREADAYQRGQEAMREAAVSAAITHTATSGQRNAKDVWRASIGSECADAIRAMPIIQMPQEARDD